MSYALDLVGRRAVSTTSTDLSERICQLKALATLDSLRR